MEGRAVPFIRVALCLLSACLLLCSCATTRSLQRFERDLSLSTGPGIIISNVPPFAPDRSNGGISAVTSLFSYWRTPVLPPASENRLAAAMNAMMVPPEEVMVDLADRRMLWSFSFYSTMAELESRLQAGIPVLVMVQDDPIDASSRRYMVVFGFNHNAAKLLAHEEKSRTAVYSYDDFKKIWKPVRNWCMILCPPGQISWVLDSREMAARARFYERTGQYGLSINDLDQLQSNDPKNTNIMLAKARVHQRARNPAAARELYRQVLALDPLNARAANNLAFALVTADQDFVEAERWARRALTVEPSNPAFLDTLGAILLAQQRPADAAAVLERARYRSSDLPVSNRREIDIRLIRAYVESGQIHLARQVLAEILREDELFTLPADLRESLQ